MAATPFRLAGQSGWAHDEGHRAGTFHTYDALDLSSVFRPRKVHVFLPRGHGGGARYPVVWLHDGDTAFWRGGIAHKTWDVAGTLSQLGDAVQDVIVVAVHPLDRNAEYTHVDWSEGRRTWGRLPQHADYLADALKPFVDAHYATRPDPSAQLVVGSSHGGLAAFWTATRRPDAFGNAGCLSPSFFSGLDSLGTGRQRPVPLSEAEIARAPVLADPARRPRIWLCWGRRRDGGDHNAVVEHLATLRGREMADLLARQHGYDRHDLRPGDDPRQDAELWVCEDPTGGHDEDDWRRRFGTLVRAFFPRGTADRR